MLMLSLLLIMINDWHCGCRFRGPYLYNKETNAVAPQINLKMDPRPAPDTGRFYTSLEMKQDRHHWKNKQYTKTPHALTSPT